jgi:nitrate/TMAO reductase-like tetraheme cytochrome c subunit
MSDGVKGWRRWLPWWPAWLGLPGLVIFVIMTVMGGAVRYSESPSFCRSCHIMEPYYQAWKTGAHKGVACVECHYPPAAPQTIAWKKFQALSQVAKYVTRTYSSKPFAEVDDQSCMRSGCHATRLLEGKILTKTGIKFDHREHLTQLRRGRQLRCTSCHSQVVVGRHIEVTYETCFLCHFKGRGEGRDLKPLGGCQACHDLPSKTIVLGGMKFNHKEFLAQKKLDCQSCHVDLVHGKGDVPQDRCFTCHNQPEKIARYGDIAFVHANHVTKHNVACFHCHEMMTHGFSAGAAEALPKPGKTLPEPPAGAVAHAGAPTLGVDCAYCHQRMHTGQLEMFTGKIGSLGLGLPEMPSPMSAAKVDCVGCHYLPKDDGISDLRGQTFKASHAACVKCHGPKFAGIWEETKAELTSTVAQLQKKSAAVASAVDASSATAGSPMRETLARADQMIRFVRVARGEHNVYLSSLALRRADAALSQVAEQVKAAPTDLSALPLISGSYCATLCHQKVGVKVPPETVKAFGKVMPHKMHTDLMGCVNCHDISAHKKVPLKKGVMDKCKECHPDGP